MDQEDQRRYRNLALVVSVGIFVSTFAQTGLIGLYPFRFLLKDQLHEGPLRVALFMQLANMPWNLKIFSGIISDALPIFGSRRRLYLAISSLAAAVLWLAVAVVPPAFVPLCVMATIMNVALVFVSTVTGGVLVEGGQEFKATGRLSALRVLMMNISGLGVPIGAFLATQALGFTALAAAVPLAGLSFIAFFLYKEPRTAKRNPQIWKGLLHQLKVAVSSKMLWATSGLLFLVQFAPGFSTPLMFYQTDVLQFSENQIGMLTLIDAFAGAAGAFFYAYFCRRFNLRTLIYMSIFFSALVTLLYLFYNDFRSAIVIEIVFMFCYYLAQLPLFDLAARSTPKGSEALGYSIIMSVWNWGLFFSDLLGSGLYEKYNMSFKSLVWVNAATTALVMVVVPFLPKLLLDSREGQAQ